MAPPLPPRPHPPFSSLPHPSTHAGLLRPRLRAEPCAGSPLQAAKAGRPLHAAKAGRPWRAGPLPRSQGGASMARRPPSTGVHGDASDGLAATTRSHSDDWRSGSVADEDLRELVRAASQRRVEQRRAELQAMARSQSMAAALSMAWIDEDAPCEFGDGPGAMGPRSQSCVGNAAGRRGHRRHRNVVPLVV